MTNPKPTETETPPEEKFKCEMCDQDIEFSRASIASTLTVLRQSILYTNKMAQSKVKKGIDALESKTNEIYEYINGWNKKINGLNRRLRDTNRYLFSLEETLLNVLLAIRQNEYLQAWYPPQNDFPAMKVTGMHPSVVDKNKRRKNVNPKEEGIHENRKD